MIDYTLIETEPRIHDLLQSRVVHQIVVLEWLFNHQQIEIVEFLQVILIVNGVSRIGVD